MERILISGTLNVIARTGKNGIFNVCELITKIGKFQIKHSSLEQYEPGSYHGIFELMEVYQKPGYSNGTVWVNQCAALNWEMLAELVLGDELNASSSHRANLILDDIDEAEPKHAPEAKKMLAPVLAPLPVKPIVGKKAEPVLCSKSQTPVVKKVTEPVVSSTIVMPKEKKVPEPVLRPGPVLIPEKNLEEPDAADCLVISKEQVDLLIEQKAKLIKIDGSINDRSLIASMRTSLKNAKYSFDVKTQSWMMG